MSQLQQPHHAAAPLGALTQFQLEPTQPELQLIQFQLFQLQFIQLEFPEFKLTERPLSG